jgi:hypothetical protein
MVLAEDLRPRISEYRFSVANSMRSCQTTKSVVTSAQIAMTVIGMAVDTGDA